MVIYLYLGKAVPPWLFGVFLLTIHNLEITLVFCKTTTRSKKKPHPQNNQTCPVPTLTYDACNVLILKQEHICSASFLKPERHMLSKVPVSMFQLSFYSLSFEVTKKTEDILFSHKACTSHGFTYFILNSWERSNIKDFISKNGSDTESTWSAHGNCIYYYTHLFKG